MTAFLIDIAVAGIVAFCAWRGYKNGLIRGVFGVVSLIAALLVANVAAQAYSKEAKAVLMPFASGMIDSTLTLMRENDIDYENITNDHESNDPDFNTAYAVLREIGLPEAASVTIAQKITDSPATEDAPTSFIDSLADKLTDSLSYIAVFGIAFLVIVIVFAVIGNLLGFVFSLPGLKLVDIIAGTAFGLCKGIILVYAIAAVVRYYGLLARTLLENTTLLLYLVNNNPIANIFGF